MCQAIPRTLTISGLAPASTSMQHRRPSQRITACGAISRKSCRPGRRKTFRSIPNGIDPRPLHGRSRRTHRRAASSRTVTTRQAPLRRSSPSHVPWASRRSRHLAATRTHGASMTGGPDRRRRQISGTAGDYGDADPFLAEQLRRNYCRAPATKAASLHLAPPERLRPQLLFISTVQWPITCAGTPRA